MAVKTYVEIRTTARVVPAKEDDAAEDTVLGPVAQHIVDAIRVGVLVLVFAMVEEHLGRLGVADAVREDGIVEHRL